jgi:hypothetical protein
LVEVEVELEDLELMEYLVTALCQEDEASCLLYLEHQ